MRAAMRIFHVSEEPDIKEFYPRLPSRTDLDPTVGLVWALDESHLPNFLTPRDCPRVCFQAGPETSAEDRASFFTSDTAKYVVIIEHGWFSRMASATLYLYEFDPAGFTLQDSSAGYYVATTPQKPIARHKVDDLFAELFCRGVELRVTDDLWQIGERVKGSTLVWSLCRMGNAKPRHL